MLDTEIKLCRATAMTAEGDRTARLVDMCVYGQPDDDRRGVPVYKHKRVLDSRRRN